MVNQTLESIVGSTGVTPWENLAASEQQRIQLVTKKVPGCVVYPETPEQLAEIIQAASLAKWRLLLCGNASKLDWGNIADQIDVVISTQRLNQVVEHAVGDFTVTLQAGVKFSDLQTLLQPTGQFFAVDPFYPEMATIGGIIATGDTGSMRQRYGSVREQVLGISFVRADGKIAKAGGRVVKNVAGYDLMKLFTGSYGSLGVITQVTLRLYPIQEASKTVVLVGETDAIAQAASTIRNSALTPTQFDLLSQGLVTKLGLGQGLGIMVRFQSIWESVQEQTQKIIHIADSFNLHHQTYEGEEETKLWLRSPQEIYTPLTGEAIMAKIGILPSYAIELLTNIEMGRIHLGSGIGNIQCRNIDQVKQIRTLSQSHQGYLTVQIAPPSVKSELDVWGYSGNARGLMQSIKSQFDPNNLLNPGRFVVG